jgi:peptidoglycan hydrolase CwlO-like protein
MSDVRLCPTCGGKAKVKTIDNQVNYTKVEDEEAFKKIAQLKKAMNKFKEKAESLEAEIARLKQ